MPNGKNEEESQLKEFRDALMKVYAKNIEKAYQQGKTHCQEEIIAFQMGKEACEKGNPRVPLHDKDFMEMTNKEKEYEQQRKTQIAWIKGYDTCKPPK